MLYKSSIYHVGELQEVMTHRDSFVTPKKLCEIHYCVSGISSQAMHTVCHLNLSSGCLLSLFTVIIKLF